MAPVFENCFKKANLLTQVAPLAVVHAPAPPAAPVLLAFTYLLVVA